MYITKITPQNALSQRAYNYRVQNPTFGNRAVPYKPIIENEGGQAVFNKMLKLIDIIPDKGRIQRPFLVAVGDEAYGIMVDKMSPSVIKVGIKNMTNNKNWEEIVQGKDVLSGEVDKQLGKMLVCDYDGMHFYRNQNKRVRKIKTENARFSPLIYGSDTWGLTTYGEKSPIIEKSKKDDSVLGSIFWGMTGMNASILGK